MTEAQGVELIAHAENIAESLTHAVFLLGIVACAVGITFGFTLFGCAARARKESRWW